MIDTRFFQKNTAISLKELSLLVPFEIIGDDTKIIQNIARLDNATSDDLTFYHNKKYKEDVAKTKAGAVVIKEEDKASLPLGVTALISQTPYRTYAKIAHYFYSASVKEVTISPKASIHSSAVLGNNVSIGDFVVIGEKAVIGNNTCIEAFSHIDANVVLGDNCYVESHCNIRSSLIGNHVHIKAGACLGQSGFGFDMDEKGPIDVPQLGRVIVEDYVEIGANTCIDRGSLNDTIIGKGSRIDNLVQIAHNVHIGKYCIIVAQVGISGSTTIGNGVVAAGQAGITGHLKIGNGVRIAAQSGVMRDIPEKTDVAGSPSMPARDWHRQTVALKRLIGSK